MGRSGGGSRSSGSKSSGFKSKSSSGSSASSSNTSSSNASSSNTKNKPNNSHNSDVSSSLLGHNAAILTAVGAALFLVNRKKDEESLNEDGESLNEDGESLNEDIQKCLNNGDKTCSEFYYKFFDDKYNECALSVKENTQTKEIIDCNSFLQMKELFNTHLNTK